MNLAHTIAFVSEAFKDKLDKGGYPYILHCIRVMNNLNTTDEELNIIAMLHDCVEDKVCTIQDLVNMKYSQRVIYSIILLTHDKNKQYMEYIKELCHDKDARLVKLADLKDNSNITRLKGLTKKDFDRMEKYHTAYTYLSNI